MVNSADSATAMREWRIFGPPGTGKTTELSRRISTTCRRFGPGSVVVMSFTKTAAVELAGRDLGLGKDRVGTLHSFAYRALGCPGIADSAKHLALWNKTAPAGYRFPDAGFDRQDPMNQGAGGGFDTCKEEISLKSQSPARNFACSRSKSVSPHVRVLSSKPVAAPLGEALLGAYSLDRSQMRETKDPAVLQFIEVWEAWKAENGFVDFTDMICLALERGLFLPVSARILYADEVQDFSPAELALVRWWGQAMDYIVLAGDDDQCIFNFRGATPDAFLDPPIPDENKIVLPVSYRLPKVIKTYADRWIKRVSRREDKAWAPREDSKGLVERSSLHYGSEGAVIGRVMNELRGPDSTAMILASCGYMLDRLVMELKSKGIPFHNPYREAEIRWNPLASVAAKSVLAYFSTDVRVHGDQARSQTWGSVNLWLAHLDAKKAGLKHGCKKRVKLNAENPELADKALSLDDFQSVLGIDPPPRGNLTWLSDRILPSKAARYAPIFQLCRHHGAKYLLRRPQIIIGTIHSVKGGQADSVFLFPDLSSSGFKEWQSADPVRRDSVVRLFYVGITRAKERLFLCSPRLGSSLAIQWI